EGAAVEMARAELLEERLGDVEGALMAVESALRLVPEHPPALLERRRLLRASSRFEALVRSLREEADQAPEPQATRLFLEIAHLQREKLGQPGEARRTFRALAARTADERRASWALGRALGIGLDVGASPAAVRDAPEAGPRPEGAADPREVARWLE